jgi:hypothetical protein
LHSQQPWVDFHVKIMLTTHARVHDITYFPWPLGNGHFHGPIL